MKTKFVISAILAAALLAACSKETPAPAPAPAAKPAAAAPAPAARASMPSIFSNPDHRADAVAMDNALKAVVDQATSSQDQAKLAPLIKTYLAARDKLMVGMNERDMRVAAFREIMDKHLKATDVRKAYGEAMGAFHKANATVPAAANVKPAPRK